jgi:hypothetical protein
MKKELAKRKQAGKPAKAELGPLTLTGDEQADASKIKEWFTRFYAASVRERNRAIRQNEKVMLKFHQRGIVQEGDLLKNVLAAEHSGDRDEGEYTFLTILKPMRERLVRDYEIKTAAEFMLLDALVLSYYQYIRAASNLHSYTAYGKSYNYETLVRYAQTYLARANELFLRNLEALRQMKAAPFVIKIEQAGQVNVGEKQVNVATGGQADRNAAREPAEPANNPEVVDGEFTVEGGEAVDGANLRVRSAGAQGAEAEGQGGADE